MARYGTTTSWFERFRFIKSFKQRLTQHAPDPRASTGVVMVGLSAFSSSFFGLQLVPSKWRDLVPPTSTPQGHTHGVLRKRTPLDTMSRKKGSFLLSFK